MAQTQQTLASFGSVEIHDHLYISAQQYLHIGAVGDGFDLAFDGTNTLNIDPVNTNDVVRIGETVQADFQVDGATDLLWDASAGGLTNGGMAVGVMPTAVAEVIAAGNPGALSVATYMTQVSVDAGGDAFTLAAGTVLYQLKRVYLAATAGGTAVITPATFADGTTATLTSAGDEAIFMWLGAATGWRLISRVNVTVA